MSSSTKQKSRIESAEEIVQSLTEAQMEQTLRLLRRVEAKAGTPNFNYTEELVILCAEEKGMSVEDFKRLVNWEGESS